MAEKKPRLSLFCSVFCIAPLVVGCDPQTARIEPEVLHCAITAGRATEIYGDITIVRVHHWVLENVRSVQLRFEYPPEVEAFRTGNILCAYPFTLDLRVTPHRIVKAASVYFKGRYLSETELNFLNTSPFQPRPVFKNYP